MKFGRVTGDYQTEKLTSIENVFKLLEIDFENEAYKEGVEMDNEHKNEETDYDSDSDAIFKNANAFMIENPTTITNINMIKKLIVYLKCFY
jgi:hypothetical protein